MKTIKDLIEDYNQSIGKLEQEASERNNRAYGGVVRSKKGSFVERITKNIVEIAWNELNGDPKRLSFMKEEIKVPIERDYLKRITNPEIKKYIKRHINKYFYRYKTDVHVNIDDKFSIGVECKAYTENAMLKRILVDFTLAKKVKPDLVCVLLQLESQLGGDFSNIGNKVVYGSYSTHTIFSYFEVDLLIFTLLEGERKVDKPIHKPGYFKEMKEENLQRVIDGFKNILRKHI
ncbi:MAG: restriction endonuclease [Ignavibacteria bacterium]|nr:restriction endonuclease [Ignavibacteria bacterium]